MTVKTYAYYNVATGAIENMLAIDDEHVADLIWPEGYAVVDASNVEGGSWSTCSAGWSYINGQFVEPPMPEQPEQPPVSGAETL